VRTLFFLTIALVSASANSQELVSLPLEPEAAVAPASTLESAVRANDFPTFDALYRAKPDPAFRALHELWTESMSAPTGAFYGADEYERLSREYPAYGKFIAQYRIVDSNGNAFYPASETRTFLLEHVAATPRVTPQRVAEQRASKRNVERRAERAAKPAERTAPAERRLPAGRSAGILPAGAREARGDVPAGSQRSGRLEAGAPRNAPQVAEVTPAPSPVVKAPVPAPNPAPESTNRGLLLLILGLIGVGLLALIMRTPREVSP
jgi:hypothetical protein